MDLKRRHYVDRHGLSISRVQRLFMARVGLVSLGVVSTGADLSTT